MPRYRVDTVEICKISATYFVNSKNKRKAIEKVQKTPAEMHSHDIQKQYEIIDVTVEKMD